MQLSAYFKRIGFAGPARAELTTLRAVHRAHVEAIPYENLDVQLGVPVTRASAPIFSKIVEGGRGGWCYEMNGLLGWALEEIGFPVRRLAGAVMREAMGDEMIGNHLVLLVEVGGETFLADAGFGDGLIEPTPLREGPFEIGPFVCRLERIEAGWWRYRNDPNGSAPSFDFHPDIADEALLEGRCQFLQSDPSSPFVQNAVVQRWRDDAHLSLRGRVLTRQGADGRSKRLISDAADYVRTLARDFALDFEEAGALWPAIAGRHDALFPGGVDGLTIR